MIITEAEQRGLLSLGYDSIKHGLKHRSPLDVSPEDYPEVLREFRATFVTIQHGGRLRGCIGAIDAVRPLVSDVSYNAHASAFKDPRFPALSNRELSGLEMSISILTPREVVNFTSEQELLEKMQPGVDGMVLEDDSLCGAFLPIMWEMLPTRKEFLSQLKRKAGLPADYWSESLRVTRFSSEYYLESTKLLS